MIPTATGRIRSLSLALFYAVLLLLLLFSATAEASAGDRLPAFRECVEVCKQENCSPGKEQTPIPLHRRLLLWDCPSECDHTCQTIVTSARVAAREPVVQFHGKWPFARVLGVQEPLSVVFSAANLWAHARGLARVRAHIPAGYPLRPFYVALARVGVASWLFSCLFHARDFPLTETLDYLGAGLSVLYGLYYTVVHHFRLDRPPAAAAADDDDDDADVAVAPAVAPQRRRRRRRRRRSVLRAWTLLCVLLYAGHVAYLTLWRWDYTYNMAANVACGLVQNVLWSWYSWSKYRHTRRSWAAWPGFAVAWIMLAMSLELFDFAPVAWGSVDAHCLWHLGTVGPTVLWYNFLVKDAQDDMAGSMERFKA